MSTNFMRDVRAYKPMKTLTSQLDCTAANVRILFLLFAQVFCVAVK
jgi:hypothetical protein